MNEALYHQLAAIEDTHWWFESRRRLVEDFLDKLDLPDKTKARGLDIGCGTGGNIGLLERYCGEVTGLDRSETALRFDRQKFPSGDFMLGDANHLSDIFKPETFDMVTIFNVLYHAWIDNEVSVLRQVRDVLKPGGILVVTEPAFGILMRTHDAQAMGKRRYRMGPFKRMIKDAGLLVVSRTYFNSINFVPALILALVERIMGSAKKHADAGEEVKELGVPNEAINRFFLSLMNMERKTMSAIGSMPFGVTLLCVARKPSNHG